MTPLKNIIFESNPLKNKTGKFKNLNKKQLFKSVEKAKKNLKTSKDVFHTFNNNFKLNIRFNRLKKFKKFKRIILIGMGGSILGAEASVKFLTTEAKKEIIFINNLNYETITRVKKIKNLKNSLFFLVSKSGNTIEVLSIINSLKKKANFSIKNTLIITEDKKSQLNEYAKKHKIQVIHHRKYIGGRYSVFSETALVPLYFMGINILKLKKNILKFLYQDKTLLIKNLNNLINVYQSKKINTLVLLSYCPELEHFLLWCQQLIAESLGKKGKGLIPIISIGPRDHHSLLQLYLDGPKDKFFYIFSVNENNRTNEKKNLFKDILYNSNISEVLNSQRNALKTVLKKKKIPFLSLELKKKNEEVLGELFSYFILETIFLSENMKINPFDQPAVEQLKKIVKKTLSRNNQK